MKLNEIGVNIWIDKMREIAHAAHKGQKRHGGEDYIEHIERVAAGVEDRLKPIALGHDLIEDTTITLEDLKKEGFPAYIITAVSLLTHKEGDSSMVYWKHILTNPDAVQVKLVDINDNLNDKPSDHAREKYARALALFKQHGYSL